MLDSKKGGIDAEELPGLFVLILFLLVLILVLFSLNYLNESKKQQQVKISFEDINANRNLGYFLQLSVDNKIVADLVSESYLNNNYEKLKMTSNQFFNQIYSPNGPMGYDISINGKSLNSAEFEDEIAKSTRHIPLINGEIVRIELHVGER
ncbi:hypothetical protein J4209_07170 [Candidatus Woesearchaeota archaeon]|nr:hypothetical protein [Candidatus Woesearchaeota archaeon]